MGFDELPEWEKEVYLFAKMKHGDTLDDSGVSYFEAHILPVVSILKQVTDDREIIMAGYLHDTVEDTETTPEEIESMFGVRVRDMVLAVTHEGAKDSYGYYFPRLDDSPDGILIKFADRLSNLSRMEAWDEKRKEQYRRKSKFWKNGKGRKEMLECSERQRLRSRRK